MASPSTQPQNHPDTTSTEEILPPITLGKGCQMRIFKSHSSSTETDDTPDQWVETSYNGDPSSWLLSVPPHWHEFHDEYMKVLSGKMEFTLEGKTIVLSETDDELCIERGKVHGFTAIKGVKVVFRERTAPSGRFKEA